jgi:hypothetical protein
LHDTQFAKIMQQIAVCANRSHVRDDAELVVVLWLVSTQRNRQRAALQQQHSNTAGAATAMSSMVKFTQAQAEHCSRLASCAASGWAQPLRTWMLL